MPGVDLATLAIRVQSLEVQAAQQGLDKLSSSGASAEQQMNKLSSASGGTGSALSTASGHASNLATQLLTLVGITVSVAAGFELIKKGIEAITQYNIGAISTAAMMLSRANIDGIKEQQAAYGEYKVYVLSMYQALAAETERHFASGKEMIGAFDAFARKGIYAAQEEAGAVGVITDAVKLLHKGYVDESTMQHEIQGLLEGHAGIRYKLAQQLKGMLGETWKEQIQLHLQDSTLLTFLEEKFKGLGVAAGDIQKNLQSQQTTLSTLIGQIGRGGLSGLYEDIVGSMVSINDYLRIHKDSLIVGISEKWTDLKWTIEQIAKIIPQITIPSSGKLRGDTSENDRSTVQTMANAWHDAFYAALNPAEYTDAISKFLSDLSQLNQSFANTASGGANSLLDKIKELDTWFGKNYSWMVDFDTVNKDLANIESKIKWLLDIFSRSYTWVINASISGLPSWLGGSTGGTTGTWQGPWDQEKGIIPGSLEESREKNRLKASKTRQIQSKQFGLYEVPEWALPPALGGEVASKPPWNPAKDQGDKGGKGTDAAMDRMKSIMDTLDKEWLKLIEGSYSEVDAWAQHMITQLDKVAREGINTEDARTMVEKVTYEKKNKVVTDFNLKMMKMAGDTTAELDLQYKEDLKNAEKIVGGKELLDYAYQMRRWQSQLQADEKIESLKKDQLSSLASSLPLLSQQLPIQSKLLDIEIERNRIKMEEQILLLVNDGRLIKSQADEIRGLQAISAQERRNAQERKGWETGGLSGAVNLWSTDRLVGMEKQVASDFKNMMQTAESWLGTTFGTTAYNTLLHKKADFQKMFQDILGNAMQWLFQRSARGLFDMAAILMAPDKKEGIGGAVSKGDGSGQLNQAAQGLNKASVGFNLNTAQFGLAAGGLLLSGIGIATNSQFLVVAGTVLQLAGLAIQLYQALTAVEQTTAAAALSGAAVSLGISAAALTSAAVALASAAGSSGSGGILGVLGSVASFFFHSGGRVMHEGGPIYAHFGWPQLKSDERHIIAQTGERVLNRNQNRDYEAGMHHVNAGGGTTANHYGDINLNFPNVKNLTKETVEREIIPAINIILTKNGQSPIGRRE